MTNQSNTKDDVLKFNYYYKNENPRIRLAMIKRLSDLHKIYDEAQGYATMILERDNDENRYLALKYLTGVAVVLAKQDEKVLREFLDYGERETAFFSMLKFELQLRDAEKGIISDEERKNILSKLRPYLKSNVRMKEATSVVSRIGTCILYPMMAIAHNFSINQQYDRNFVKMVKHFYECSLDMDVTPILSQVEEQDAELLKFIKEGPQLARSVENMTEIEENQAEVKETTQTEQKHNVEKPIKTATKKTIKEINDEVIESEEFLKYELLKFAQCEDFDNVPLKDFNYEETRTIMGKIKKTLKVVPFKNAKNAQEVKEVFGGLDQVLQIVFLQEIFQEYAKSQLLDDINNYENLGAVLKESVKAICELDENLKLEITKDQKQKAKDIRRLVRLSKRDDAYYGISEFEYGKED